MIEKEKYLRVYFGTAADYYLEKYRLFHRGKRFSFNPWPFFFGLFWFLYRKFWSESIIFLLLVILVTILEQKLLFPLYKLSDETQRNISFASTLVFGTVSGLVGNYLYLMRAEKIITEILSFTADEDERLLLLSETGGTSWLMIIGFFGLVISAVKGYIAYP